MFNSLVSHIIRSSSIYRSRLYNRFLQTSQMPRYLELPEYNPNIRVDKNAKNFKPIVWIDCEMTGLDVFNDHIIEICCLITDGDLNILDPGYESVIHYPPSVLNQMNDWCIQHHGESGLSWKVVNSTNSLEQVQQELLNYVRYFTKKNSAVLAGNSVHMDRAFMMREFPEVLKHLHYRIIDVSSISEIGNRHNRELMKQVPRKREAHTARADILESIAQLKWLRDNYFVSPPSRAW